MKYLNKVNLAAVVVLFASVSWAQFGNIEAGKSKAMNCFACHGNNGNSTNPMYPSLAGQKADVLFKKMKDYKNDKVKTPNAPMMKPMMAPLSEQDLKDLAAYFESMKPAEAGAKRRRRD